MAKIFLDLNRFCWFLCVSVASNGFYEVSVDSNGIFMGFWGCWYFWMVIYGAQSHLYKDIGCVFWLPVDEVLWNMQFGLGSIMKEC